MLAARRLRRFGLLAWGLALAVALGDALAATGVVRAGATMTEIIDALANQPGAAAGLAAARSGKPLALVTAKLRAPTINPPAIWAAAANYRAHQAEIAFLN